jgi:hypothetical protein
MSIRGAERAGTAEFNDSPTVWPWRKIFFRMTARRGKNVYARIVPQRK